MSKGPHYDKERIGAFKQGAVVRVIADTYHNMIGHVQKFGINEYGEITVVVDLCNGATVSYHWTALQVMLRQPC